MNYGKISSKQLEINGVIPQIVEEHENNQKA